MMRQQAQVGPDVEITQLTEPLIRVLHYLKEFKSFTPGEKIAFVASAPPELQD
jgi:hypothetical protein